MAEAKRRGYGEDGIYFDHRGDCRDSAHHKTCSGRWRGVVSLGFAADGARLFSPIRIVAIDLSDARLGADVTIEAVGVLATFELAVKLARPGGRIANIGVHGEAATLHPEEQWIRGHHDHHRPSGHLLYPILMRLITTGQVDARRFITHRFDLDEFEAAYDAFARAADTDALKVVLSR